MCPFVDKTELIDTLWNVNTKYILLPVTVLGINRYIMECKFRSQRSM